MTEQFSNPLFLKEGVRPGYLEGKEYGEGAFTVVANLENLPKILSDQVPEGYVLKQYKDWRLDTKGRLFGFEPDASSEIENILEKRSLPGMANRLQARQRKFINYFGKELPNFIIPSQFIVGTGEDGVGHVYEVQKKIEPGAVELPECLHLPVDKFENPMARTEAIGQLAKEVRAICGEKSSDVKKDLEVFIRFAESLVDNEGWFPDIAPGNMIFTKEGFRCLDTNCIVPLSVLESRGMHKEAKEARAMIKLFIQSLKDLAKQL